MKFNWMDIVLLCLLSLSFYSGYRKSLFRGIINLIVACTLITFILICLDSVTLPDFLVGPLSESIIVEKFLRFFDFTR
ncbi:MAG: hypothetical protein ISS46_01385 [Candidatus Omnitrophica bacterium]|nr:hypothetical protein [Candidatus Omnitrophota bacterium]